MSLFAAVAFGLTGAFLAVLSRRAGDEYGFCVSLFCACALGIALLPSLGDILGAAKDYIGISGIGGESFTLLFKAVGAGYTAQAASDICEDAGQSSVASKIRLAGKVSITVMTLPVLKTLFDTVTAAL